MEDLKIEDQAKKKLKLQLEKMERQEQDRLMNIELFATYETFQETGYIDENREEILLNMVELDAFFYKNTRTGREEIIGQRNAAQYLFKALKKRNLDCKNANKIVTEYARVGYFIFDLDKPLMTNEHEYTLINSFDAKKTKWPLFSEISKQVDNEFRFKNLKKLKSKAPHIYALLMNLHEEDEKAVEYVINLLALFFRDKKKIEKAIIHAGIQGSGKGVLFNNIIAILFGKDYVIQVSGKHLKSNFNHMLENKLGVNFNEISANFKQHDTAGEDLKMFTTEKTISIERKNIDRYEAVNLFMTFMSTNNMTSIVIPPSDRRSCYFKNERTLLDVSLNDFDEDIDVFIDNVEKENDELVIFLANWEIDKKLSFDAYKNESRRSVQRSTSNSFAEIVFFIKQKEFTELFNLAEEKFIDYDATKNDSNNSDYYCRSLRNYESVIAEISINSDSGFITSNSLRDIYNIFVKDFTKENISAVALGKIFGTYFEKESKKKKVGGKVVNTFKL